MAATQQLDETAFATTSNLYIWNYKTVAATSTIDAAFGGINMAVTGALTQQDDHLGNSVFCEFDGSVDFTTSNNVAFQSDTSFSVGGWYYHGNWSAGATNARMIGNQNADAAAGWFMVKNTTNIQTNVSDSSGEGFVNVTHGLTGAAWNHIVMVWDNSTNVAQIYANAVDLSAGGHAHGFDSPSGAFAHGAARNGNGKYTGRIADQFIQFGVKLTASEVSDIFNFGVTVGGANLGGLILFPCV